MVKEMQTLTSYLPLGETIFAVKMSKKEDFPNISQSNSQSMYKLFMPFILEQDTLP